MSRVDDLDKKLEVYASKVDIFIEDTRIYRASLCKKLDGIISNQNTMLDRFSSLQCGVQKEKIENLNKRVDGHGFKINGSYAFTATVFILLVGAVVERVLIK